MRWTSWQPEVSLTVFAQGVMLRAPAEATVSREAFLAGALHDEVMRALSTTALVEALAEVQHGPLARCIPPEGRPQVTRTVGFGARGQIAPGYWIFGRRARISHGETWEVPLEALVRDPSLAAALPAELAGTLLRDAQQLAPLACMCGTGATTAEEHGELETLVSPVQHPDAPITCEASVARCRVCGRVWVLTAEGDDHYEWRLELNPYQGPMR